MHTSFEILSSKRFSDHVPNQQSARAFPRTSNAAMACPVLPLNGEHRRLPILASLLRHGKCASADHSLSTEGQQFKWVKKILKRNPDGIMKMVTGRKE